MFQEFQDDNIRVTIPVLIDDYEKNNKLLLIKHLRTFRRTNKIIPDGLIDCKCDVESCHSLKDLLALFNTPDNTTQDMLFQEIPIIFEHYKSFGFSSPIKALQHFVNSLEQ